MAPGMRTPAAGAAVAAGWVCGTSELLRGEKLATDGPLWSQPRAPCAVGETGDSGLTPLRSKEGGLREGCTEEGNFKQSFEG